MASSDPTAQYMQQIYDEFGTSLFSQNWVAQDWTLWDMVGYASSNKFNFFSVPAGSNDPNLGVNKKGEQTNLGTSNQIGGDYYFVITQIRLFVLNSAKVRQLGTGVATETGFSAQQLQYARFLSALTQQGVLTLNINQKDLLTENQPFQRFGAGFGLGVVIPPAIGGTSAINGGANAYGANTPYDIDGGCIGDPFSLGMPMVLAPSTPFKVTLDFPLANSPSNANIYGASIDQPATVWLACMLCGQRLRPRS